jgi:hypothetical protein
MKLKKAQKEAVLKWIAEGLETDEINKRAAKFKPHFTVSRSQVDWYRKTRRVNLGEIQHEGEADALTSGLAVKENRVATLQKLANRLLEDLLGAEDKNRLWLDMVKGIGSHDNYERVEYQEFNRSEVEALRGLLDDIATEVGGRVHKTDLTTGGKPLPRSGVDPKQLKGLTNDELAILENAAEILERGEPDQDAAVKS